MIQISSWLPKGRQSHPISRLLRPVFEHKKAKPLFGGVLSATSLALAIGFYPVAHNTPVVAMEPEITIQVETATAGPEQVLPKMTGISQGFYLLHPGVDITAPLGSEIHPVAPGKVIKVEFSKFDYGRSVVIDHGDGITSRYAHMGKIKVEEGDEVTTSDVVGEVGVTGHTTGPHLHLEIRKDGSPLNPLITLRKLNGQTKG